MNRFVRVYLMPGAVLQSVMIGGGYGTGREIVEFFTRFGVAGGLYGLATSGVCIAVVFVLSLEIARRFGVYDYRRFFRVLLGRFWFTYEILGAVMFMLVIAVIGAASGNVMQDELGLPAWLGVVLMMGCVVAMTFFGRALVTTLLTYWSVALYVVFAACLIGVALAYGERLATSFAAAEARDGWFTSGLQYAFYNVTAIPVVLYAATAIETRREAAGAGVAGAAIAILPAVMLHSGFAAAYPDVIAASLPMYELFTLLSIPVLKLAYLVVLFGTFIETSAGTIQGFIERLDNWRRERTGKPLNRPTHALLAFVALSLAGSLSALGIVTLIADGYGTLAWGFLFVYVLPLVLIGPWRLKQAASVRAAQSTDS